jgi:hypothetical protein
VTGKLSELVPPLTAAGAAANDIVEVLDVSDTAMAPTGTNKPMVLSEVAAFTNAQAGKTAANVSFSPSAPIDSTDVQSAIVELYNEAPLYRIALGTRFWPGIVVSGMGNQVAFMPPMGWARGGMHTRFGLTTPVFDGGMIGGINAVGTPTAAAFATTRTHTAAKRIEYLVTTPATNAVAGVIANAEVVRMPNSLSSARNGFIATFRWGPATGVATTTMRGFAGFVASASNPTDVEPSSLVNMFGMGWDAADTTVQFMSNDASGTATKTSVTSASVPTNDRMDFYTLTIMVPMTNPLSVHWHIQEPEFGLSRNGSVTTDLPANDTALYPTMWVSAGGTSSVVGMSMMSFEVWSVS